ncbi:MAG: RNA polymerase sigma factor [Lachnospiraceae bacterium]|nr:RNA polymerase sigma factor [Lachnospiraceae bacterium]
MDNGASSYRRYLEGDDEGIADIVREYKDGLILYLNGYVDNMYTSEDLTEDTFFKLMTKKPGFSGRSTFKTWLYTIGRNIAVDWLRRESKQTELSPEDMEQYQKDESDLEHAYIRDERKRAVHRSLRKLAPDYRAALWLVYFEDFSGKEASAILKKNDRQMKNLLYRAKQSLKSELEKEGFTYEEF